MERKRLPYVYELGKLTEGTKVVITGVSKRNASRFNINFENTADGPNYCDTAFVFDVRFNFGKNKKVIVRNTRLHGVWGTEERNGMTWRPFPFAIDEPFQIEVVVKKEEFEVVVDGKSSCLYKNRVSLNQLESSSFFRVDGDAEIEKKCCV